MKKTAQMIPLFVLLLLVAQPVHALTVLVKDNGSMTFSQGTVLGDSDQKDAEKVEEKQQESEKKSNEMNREVEKKTQETNREIEKKAQEINREVEKKEREMQRETQKVLRTVSSQENKLLRVKNGDDSTDVILERKGRDSADDASGEGEKFRSQERLETGDLKLELPTDDTRKMKAETENENVKMRLEERKDRLDKLQVTTKKDDNGKQEFEFESGAAKAKLQASEFTVDPATNTVTITTPSGEQHQLIHLPDQAIERMRKAGLLNSSNATNQSDLNIETKADGTVVYKTKVEANRKIFGLIPFRAEQEAELEDSTGKVSLNLVNDSAFNRFLFNLSR